MLNPSSGRPAAKHALRSNGRGGWRRVGIVLFEIGLAVGLISSWDMWVASRYRILVDPSKGERCLPYRWYFVDLRERTIRRGDYVLFRSLGMTPFYPDGTWVIKVAAGAAGDRVVVDVSGVSINGAHWGELWHVQRGQRLWQMGRRPVDYMRNERVPERHWWVMGTSPRSFDSRYWGYIDDDQVIARAHALW
jgi:conjugal transfer pilin signal peptidase TrbI